MSELSLERPVEAKPTIVVEESKKTEQVVSRLAS